LSKHFAGWPSLWCGEASGELWIGNGFGVFNITGHEGASNLAAAVGTRSFVLVERPPHVLIEVRLRYIRWDTQRPTGLHDFSAIDGLFKAFDVHESPRVLEWEAASGRPGHLLGRTEAAFTVLVRAAYLEVARTLTHATRFSATNSTAPVRCHNEEGNVVAWVGQTAVGPR
jgi:hypothetical protein